MRHDWKLLICWSNANQTAGKRKYRKRKYSHHRTDYTAGRISAEEAWHRTQKVQEESKKFQARTDKMSRLITSDDPSANPPMRPPQGRPPSLPQPFQVIRVQVEPNRESDWVTLPPGRQCNVKARGGKMFFIFPNGQRMEVRAGEANLGMLPGRRFKLAGDTAGEAVFTIY